MSLKQKFAPAHDYLSMCVTLAKINISYKAQTLCLLILNFFFHFMPLAFEKGIYLVCQNLLFSIN